MTIQRRFAPISGRFEPESLAGLTGIYISHLFPKSSLSRVIGVQPGIFEGQ